MRNKLLIGSIVLSLCLSALALFFKSNTSDTSPLEGKIVYIDNVRVFEEFAMKKEYDKQLEKELYSDRRTLDSLGESLNRKLSTGVKALESEKETFLRFKEGYEVKFREISNKYTNQVYERLNDLITEYGKSNHYHFILGSGGEGNVMYVAEKKDVTKNLVEFINKKYLDN